MIAESAGKVENDLDRNGESLRSCGIARYCRRSMFLEELKA